MRIVITGKDSYIGNNIQSYIEMMDSSAIITQLDVIDNAWKNFDFAGYDVVIHVAAIVHRKDVADWELYKSVNTDLPIEIAERAKAQGVKQFVFLSTMAVYGYEKTLSLSKSIITKDTELNPTTMYGKSKYLAEVGLQQLETESFHISIVRPPNVYGPGCRGGYIKTYRKITEMLPVIPEAFTSVKQSVIYIDNLSSLIYLLVVRRQHGIFTPQDDKAVSAVEIMECISEILKLKKKRCKILGKMMKLLSFVPLVKKGYGGVAYAKDISQLDDIDYIRITFKEAMERTVLYENQCNNPGL